jgi:hypothetical protein
MSGGSASLSARAKDRRDGNDIEKEKRMVRDKRIVIRVSAEDKANLEDAAKARSQSITSFLVEAGKKEAAKKPRVSSAGFRGIPTNIKAGLYEAQHGGTNGYFWVGKRLAAQLESLVPYDMDFDQWDRYIDDLHGMVSRGDDPETWAWLKRFFPRVMQLVPSRRKEQFLKGLYSYAEEEWIL